MKVIDMQNWKRKDKYELFSSMTNPYFNICANVDITELKSYLKTRDISFFKGLLFIVFKVMNEIPEVATRIQGDKVVQYDKINTSFTILLDDENFDFCFVRYEEDFSLFIDKLTKAMDKVRSGNLIDRDARGDDLFYLTSLPWVSFTSIQHPMDLKGQGDTIPRIAVGKYFKDGDRLKLPLSIQLHHGLADGLHAGKFFMKMEKYLEDPDKIIL